MKQFPKSFGLLLALVLIGAGCASAPATNTNDSPADQEGSMETENGSGTTVTTPSDDTEDGDDNENESGDDEGRTSGADAGGSMAIDESWKTYTNAALGFEFMWPSKGRYAPQWNVTFEQEGSTDIVDGCFAADGDGEDVTLGGTEFCRTATTDAAGSRTRYVTKIGSTYTVLTFTKAAAARAAEGFSAAEYDAHLDQIVSTFKVTK